MSSLFVFAILSLSVISAKIALHRSITLNALLKMFGKILVTFFALCILINLILDQTELPLIHRYPSDIPKANDNAQTSISQPIPKHFHHRGLTAEVNEDDDDIEEGGDDNQGNANSDWELPANIWKEKETFTTLSPEQLEENAKEWSMDGIFPQLDHPDLKQCGDPQKYYISDLDAKSALRYFDKIQIWPIPQKFHLYAHSVIIKRDVQWTCNCGDGLTNNQILKSAINRYDALIFPHRIDSEFEFDFIKSDGYYFDSIHLEIDEVEGLKQTQIPSDDMDESYELILPFKGQKEGEISKSTGCHTVYIHSRSIFGALRAMETLSQIIAFDFDRNLYSTKYVGYIWDWPFFKYRGVLLDTSRHFHPPQIIKHFIDSIAFAKFNVFHWHLVDDQSWPFPIDNHVDAQFDGFNLSDLYTKSSWSKSERYSMNDILDIIHYANIRGIRVIPEFDVPGHVGSWCRTFDICLDVPCDESTTSGVLDPSKPLTFKVVEAVYDAITSVFGDKMIHIGNDEANYQCFENNTNLLEWFHQNDIASMQIEGIRSRKKKDGIKINAVTVTKIFEV